VGFVCLLIREGTRVSISWTVFWAVGREEMEGMDVWSQLLDFLVGASSSSPPIGIAFPPPLGELPPTSRLPRLPLAMNSDDDEDDAVDDDMMWWCADGEKPRAVAGRRRRAMDLFIVAAGVGGVFAVG